MTDCIATVGTFDGFHAGHTDLLLRLVEEGRKRSLPTRLITFTNHPLSVVAPARMPQLVRSRRDMESIPLSLGVGRVLEMHFTRELADMTARQFITLIRDRYGVRVLLMGFNNHIGSDRISDHEQLTKIGAELGVELIFADELRLSDGTIPCSTRVREAVVAGDMDLARRLLIYSFRLDGIVRSGRRLGRKLGFPTVNLSAYPGVVLPKEGVYVGAIDIDGILYNAVINVGKNPTVAADNPVTIEAHSIDGTVTLTDGDECAFVFYSRLRDEMKFDGLTSLCRAINSDVKAAQSWLRNHTDIWLPK